MTAKSIVLSLISFLVFQICSAQSEEVRIRQEYNGQGWSNVFRVRTLQNVLQLRQEQVYSEWNGISGLFVDVSREQYFHGAQNRLAELRNEEWSTAITSWEPLSRRRYAYFPNGNTLADTLENWLSGLWLPSQATSYVYSNGRIDTAMIFGLQPGFPPLPAYLTTFTYNAQGRVLTSSSYLSINNNWIPERKSRYTYTSAGLEDSVLLEVGIGQNWEPFLLTRKHYNANGDLDTSWVEQFTASGWRSLNRTLYLYQPQDNYNYLQIISLWDTLENSWTNYLRDTLYRVVAGGIDAPQETKPTLFPNPSRDFVRFAGLNTQTTVEVFSMQGVLLFSSQLEQHGWLDLSHLPRGMVYVRWQGPSNKRGVQRLLLVD
jgi:hypothetical protein